MSSSRDKKSETEQLTRHRIAGAIFAATKAMGITDRDLAEQLTEQVIQRLESGQLGPRLPFPGMEELMPKKDRGPLADSEVKRLVQQTLKEMGHREGTLPANPALQEPALKEEAKPAPPAPAVSEKAVPSEATPSSTASFSANALRVLEKRYLTKDSGGKVTETTQDMLRRVAQAIAAAEKVYHPEADVESWAERFYQVMESREFLPNSPTLMNAGRELGQLSACFVLPVEDSMESIFDAVKYTALIHKSGGGTGFSFSHLRPENDRVGSTGGVASGPVSFIRAFDVATEVIKQGGMRRGANMAVLNVNHPDILRFITAKENTSSFNNFNFSVAITEDFMRAVDKDEEYDLINPRTKQTVQKLKAREVFDKIVQMAWKTGDPGIVFLDRINRDNPVPKLGMIESTNPCGEQPLLPYESCNLGSINLSRMLRQTDGKAEIDYARMGEMVRLAVRFLDNVIEVNRFPLPQIEKMSKATRKIGLGVMGFADMLILLGIPYDSESAVETAESVMRFISEEALAASKELAEERGTFPAFKGSAYDLPRGNKVRVRNAARTTIAPTGTLSIIADCSSGIEPLFALSYTRTILEGERLIEVNPYFKEVAQREGFYSEELIQELAKRGSVRGMPQVPEEVQRLFVTAHDIAPEWHVRIQASFQKHVENAVSKTVNFPHHATQEDVARVFRLACEMGCKGVTIYRDKSKESQVLSFGEKAGETVKEGVSHGPRSRPRVTSGFTEKVSTGCGHIYITVNRDERGACEVFSSLGKAGGCAAAQLEAISRLISVALRSGVDAESLVPHLRGIRCPSIAWEDGHAVLSCPDAIASVLEHQAAEPKGGNGSKPSTEIPPENIRENSTGQCPECGNLLVYQEGCHHCLSCGYTKC